MNTQTRSPIRLATNHANSTIILSIVAAMICRAIPLPREMLIFNPDWILLVVIYWCLIAPERFGIGSSWFVGLLTDVLTGQLLGQYALAYAIVAYITVRLHRRLRVFPVSQQILIVLFLLLLSNLLIFWSQNVQGTPRMGPIYLAPPLVGALTWPLIFIGLGRLGHKSRLF